MRDLVYKGVVYKNYSVDPCGDIISKLKNRKLKQAKNNKKGYNTVSVVVGDGKRKTVFVHRAVYETYNEIDNVDEVFVRHIDGDRSNNHVSNLTSKETYGMMRYSKASVHKICKMLEEGIPSVRIAERMGVKYDLILHIIHKRAHVDVSEKYDIKDPSFYHKRQYNSDERGIREVCRMISEGESLVEISRKTTMSYNNVTHIATGKIWEDISKEYDFSIYRENRYGRFEKNYGVNMIISIATLIDLGCTNSDIIKAIDHVQVPKYIVQDIRDGIAFSDITEKFSFMKDKI